MKKLKKLDIFDILLILAGLGFVGVIVFYICWCVVTYKQIPTTTTDTNVTVVTQEQAIITYEKVPATVISTNKRQWFAGCMHRIVKIKVHNDTYNLDKTIEENYNGMMVGPLWDIKEGDTVTVEVYYYKMPSTGERVSTPHISHIVT